jgi:hypothetical protein
VIRKRFAGSRAGPSRFAAARMQLPHVFNLERFPSACALVHATPARMQPASLRAVALRPVRAVVQAGLGRIRYGRAVLRRCAFVLVARVRIGVAVEGFVSGRPGHALVDVG